jgi:threonine dehydratase
VAFSSGNHAQAVALAARELGIGATIVMPDDAPQSKLDATRGYGARVVIYSRSTGAGPSREELARRIVDETGAILVPPFDDPAVIAGQGTLAMELLEEIPELDLLVTPCGGGGLLSGCCLAATAMCPGIRLWGVEPEAGDDMRQSFALGEPVSIPVPKTIADSLQTTRPGNRTLAIIRALAQGIVTVSDEELVTAVRFAAERLKVVVEPGGAAALAAVLSGKLPLAAGERVGVVLSGGNVDLKRLGEWLSNRGG